MTHKDAPPVTSEQQRFEETYRILLAWEGATCGFSRDKHGAYHAAYARTAWLAWCVARGECTP